MNYTKPEVAVLGQAVIVIEGTTHTKVPNGILDADRTFTLKPAYDLDE